MRTARTFLVTAVALGFLVPTQVRAQDVLIQNSTFYSGKFWIGGAYAKNGTFDYCAISANYGAYGTTLMFGLDKGYSGFMIAMGNTTWSLPTGHFLYAKISIDNQQWAGTYRAVPDSSTELTFFFKPNVDFLKSIASGAQLVITTSKQTFQFNLLGTETSIPQLVLCVSHYTGETNPFDIKPPTSNPFDSQ